MSNSFQNNQNNNEERSTPLSQDQYAQDEIDQTNNENNDGGNTKTRSPDSVTLRSLLTTKGAGVVIGKAGKTVEQLRELTGAKAGVSKVIMGVNDRVLTISGTVEQVHKAYGFIAKTFLESPSTTTSDLTATIRLLISHTLMGSIIGRQGSKIKQIQDVSGVRMTASKEMLPQSTERIVEIQGKPENISLAIAEIAQSIKDDWERGSRGTVYYDPKVRVMNFNRGGRYQNNGNYHNQGNYYHTGHYNNGYNQNAAPRRFNNYDEGRYRRTGRGEDFTQRSDFGPDPNDPRVETKTIPIPSDMVGCIIGRAGTKISEIRRKSGCRISIAKETNDEGERLFTCIGTPEANEKALELLLAQLEIENKKRVQDREAPKA